MIDPTRNVGGIDWTSFIQACDPCLVRFAFHVTLASLILNFVGQAAVVESCGAFSSVVRVDTICTICVAPENRACCSCCMPVGPAGVLR